MVRHGQASFGSHHYDKLSTLGQRQAIVLARRLATGGSPIGKLVSGNLDRQRATAQAIYTECGVTVEIDDRWDEYDHVRITGDQSSALIFDPFEAADARDRAESTLDEAVRRWIAGDMAHRESHADFVERCRAALGSLTANPGTTVVATSGGVIAVICTLLLDLPTDTWPSMSRVTINCGITKVVTGRRGTSLVSFNDHAHLEQDRAMITYR
jgi:broad specificity phosphatase PhoE